MSMSRRSRGSLKTVWRRRRDFESSRWRVRMAESPIDLRSWSSDETMFWGEVVEEGVLLRETEEVVVLVVTVCVVEWVRRRKRKRGWSFRIII